MFYVHWWDLNPQTGAGWPTFKTVIQRVQRFLGDEIVWMRPSECTDRLHVARSSSVGE